MKSILSGQRWILACLAICLASPLTEILRAQDKLRFNVALLQLPQLANPHISVDEVLEEARLAREDRRRRMSFFEAIAANDQGGFLSDARRRHGSKRELPLPVPIEFQKRFSDGVLRYYVSSEEGFTGLMFATALRNHAFVKLLLEAGADPWKLTKRHKTYALWLAAKQNDIEIMRTLMGIGPTHESQAFRITIDLLPKQPSSGETEKSCCQRRSRRAGALIQRQEAAFWSPTNTGIGNQLCIRPKCPSFCDYLAANSGSTWARCPDIPLRTDAFASQQNRRRRLYASVPIGTLVEIR